MKTPTLFFLGAVAGVLVHKALYQPPKKTYPPKDSLTPSGQNIRGIGAAYYDFEIKEAVLSLWKNRTFWYIQKDGIALDTYPQRGQMKAKGAIERLWGQLNSTSPAAAKMLHEQALKYSRQSEKRQVESYLSNLGLNLVRHFSKELDIDLELPKGQQKMILGV